MATRQATGSRRVKTSSPRATPRVQNSSVRIYGRQTVTGIRPAIGIQYHVAGTNKKISRQQMNNVATNIAAARAHNINRSVAIGIFVPPAGAAAYAMGRRKLNKAVRKEFGTNASILRTTARYNTTTGRVRKVSTKRVAGSRGGAARRSARRHYARDARGRFT